MSEDDARLLLRSHAVTRLIAFEKSLSVILTPEGFAECTNAGGTPLDYEAVRDLMVVGYTAGAVDGIAEADGLEEFLEALQQARRE